MDSKTLLELKKEYLQHLQDVLVEPFLNEFQTIYDTTFKSTSSGKVLQEFQQNVSQVPQWNHIMIEGMYERVLHQSKCDFLGDLIRAIFVTYVRFNLASHGKLQNNNQVKIKVPNAANFIHKCLVACARVVWSQPYLFYHAVRTIERQHNRIQADDAFRKAIASTVRNAIPWDQLLNITVGNEKLEEDVTGDFASTDESEVSEENVDSDSPAQESSDEESSDDNESDSTFENDDIVQIEENRQSEDDAEDVVKLESEAESEAEDEAASDAEDEAESDAATEAEDEAESELASEAEDVVGGEAEAEVASEEASEEASEAEDEVEQISEVEAENQTGVSDVLNDVTNYEASSEAEPENDHETYEQHQESDNIVPINDHIHQQSNDDTDDDELIQLTESDIPLIIAEPEDNTIGNAINTEDDVDSHIVTIFKKDNDTIDSTYVSSSDVNKDESVKDHSDKDDEQQLKRTVIIDPKKVHKPKYAPKGRITDAFF